MRPQELNSIIAAIAEELSSPPLRDDPAALERYLHKEILGILRVHNDDVRRVVLDTATYQVQKWRDTEDRCWEALWKVCDAIRDARLPFDYDQNSN